MLDPRDFCTKTVAKKVVYEYGMFTFLGKKLRELMYESDTFIPGDVTYLGTGSEPDDCTRMTYALLESFLLHTRVLHDFFYKAPAKDDVVASHFVPDWNRDRPALDSYLGSRDRRERLDKALAHLTLHRLDYDSRDKRWNVDTIIGAIDTTMKRFFQLLPDERKPWFVEAP